MNINLIGTILIILFLVFLLGGFLLGLKGAKKSALSLTFFIVAIAVAVIITPIVAKSVMNISITIDNVKTTLSDYILVQVGNVNGISDILATSPSLSLLIQNLPLMLGNLVVFVLLCYIIGFISWILYLIVSSAFLSQPKTSEVINTTVKRKKFRLLGGAVGALHGLLLMLVTFVPITGIVSIVNDISTSTEVVYAQEETAPSPSAKLLEEYLPSEVKQVINVYNKSLVSKVSNVAHIGDLLFKNVSSVKINRTTMNLRDEILSITNIYDNVAFLEGLDFSHVSSIKAIDFNKLEKAVKHMFNSNIIKTMLPDMANIAFDQLLKMNQVSQNEDLKALVEILKQEFNENNNITNNLQEELQTIINTAKICVESKFIDEVEDFNNIHFNNIFNLLAKDENKLLKQFIETAFNSKLLNKAVVFGLNMGVEEVEKLLANEINEEVYLGRIDIADKDMYVSKPEMTNFLVNLMDASVEISKVGFDELANENFIVLFDLDFGKVITQIGTSMETFKNMAIFAESGIYKNTMTALNKTHYSKYIDFNVLTENNVWEQETLLLAKVFNGIVDSNILSYIKHGNEIYVKNEDISNIIKSLASLQVVDGASRTRLSQIINPLFESTALKNIVGIAFDELNNFIYKKGIELGNVDLGTINTKRLYDETERENILAFFDNTVLYLKDINITQLQEDPFLELINSDLTMLGSALDSLNATSLFKQVADNSGTVVNDGIYYNLFKKLADTEYAKYVDFLCVLEDDFSWNVELAKATTMIDTLKNKTIITSIGTEVSLIEYIVKHSNLENVFKQISAEDLKAIFTPLLESTLFKPTGLLVLNEINSQIKNIVGDLGSDIIDIENIPQQEIPEVIEILGDISELVDEFTSEGFDISSVATGETKEQLAKLLTSLQDNSNNEGVFTNAYTAFLGYIQEDATIGTQVSDLISQYGNGEVDWSAVLGGLVI